MPVPAGAITAAARWTRAFLYRPGQTQQQWISRLRPLTTPEYLGILSSAGNDEAAPRQMSGEPIGVSAAEGSAIVDVPTDQRALRLELVDNGADGWQIASADDAPTATAEPAQHDGSTAQVGTPDRTSQQPPSTAPSS